MVMKDVFDNLKRLQDVLAEKYRLEAVIEESPQQLVQQDKLLARLKKEYSEKNTKYEELRSGVEHLRAQLAEAEASRESGEKGMDNITTHREYEALDKQISEAKEREEGLRKDLQREEKALEELNEILRADNEMITSQENELNKSKADLEDKINAYKSELDEKTREEAEIIPGIDQEIVYKFQRIIRRNRDGIVAVKNGVCSGCHMILPAQFANEVRDGEKILFCPYCSRILNYEPAADGEEETYYAASEIGSLSDLDDVLAREDSIQLDDDVQEDSEQEQPLEFGSDYN